MCPIGVDNILVDNIINRLGNLSAGRDLSFAVTHSCDIAVLRGHENLMLAFGDGIC